MGSLPFSLNVWRMWVMFIVCYAQYVSSYYFYKRFIYRWCFFMEEFIFWICCIIFSGILIGGPYEKYWKWIACRIFWRHISLFYCLRFAINCGRCIWKSKALCKIACRQGCREDRAREALTLGAAVCGCSQCWQLKVVATVRLLIIPDQSLRKGHTQKCPWDCYIGRFRQEKVNLCPVCILYLCLLISFHVPAFLSVPLYFWQCPFCVFVLLNFWMYPPSATRFLHLHASTSLTAPTDLCLCPSSLSMSNISDCTRRLSQCLLISDHVLWYLTMPIHFLLYLSISYSASLPLTIPPISDPIPVYIGIHHISY